MMVLHVDLRDVLVIDPLTHSKPFPSLLFV